MAGEFATSVNGALQAEAVFWPLSQLHQFFQMRTPSFKIASHQFLPC
jgi:hypothetical protein